MMNSIALGQMVIEGVPFVADPADDGKFVMTDDARHTFLGNIMKASVQSMNDYSELMDRSPDSDAFGAFKQILAISSDGFKWAFDYIKNNYPGAVDIEDAEKNEFDFLLVYVTEAVYGGYTESERVKASFNYDLSNKVIEVIMKSDDHDLKRKLMSHIEMAKELGPSKWTFEKIIDEIMSNYCLNKLLPQTMASMLYMTANADSIDQIREHRDKGLDILVSAMKCNWSSIDQAINAFAGISKVIGFINHCIYINKVPTDEMIADFFKEPDKYLDYFDFKDFEGRM